MTEIIIKKKKSLLGRLLKYTLFLSFFCVVIFTVLASVGGNEPHHKEMIEQYVSEVTGYSAQIHKFNSLNFFPLIIIDFENLELRNDYRKMKGLEIDSFFTDPVAYANKVYLVSGFWDVAFSSGKIRALEVKELYAIPDSIIHDEMTIEYLTIVDSEDDKSYLYAIGKFGETEYEIRKEMEVFGKKPKQSYRIIHSAPLNVKVGESKAILNFENNFENPDKPVLKITGVIKSETLGEGGVRKDSPLNKNLQKLWKTMGNPQKNIDVQFDVPIQRKDGETIPLEFNNGLLSIKKYE